MNYLNDANAKVDGIAMPTVVTMKEWAAEYRRNNQWEQQERIARLPQLSVENSVQSYFALCEMLLPFVFDAEKNADLREAQLRHYESLADKWRRLARWKQHVPQP
ncbi:MAG: hypothetical protein HY260_19440 [Chloroflexi bacterium]|nr:hypothetical protein [Chloroflexota bacterium]